MIHGPSTNVYSHSANQEYPHFYGTRSLIIVFTKPCHWTLGQSQFIPVHTFMPSFSKIHFNIIPPYTPNSSTWYFPFRFYN